MEAPLRLGFLETLRPQPSSPRVVSSEDLDSNSVFPLRTPNPQHSTSATLLYVGLGSRTLECVWRCPASVCLWSEAVSECVLLCSEGREAFLCLWSEAFLGPLQRHLPGGGQGCVMPARLAGSRCSCGLLKVSGHKPGDGRDAQTSCHSVHESERSGLPTPTHSQARTRTASIHLTPGDTDFAT